MRLRYAIILSIVLFILLRLSACAQDIWSVTLSGGEVEDVALSSLTTASLTLSLDGITQGVPLSSLPILRHRVGTHALSGAIVGSALGLLAGGMVPVLDHGLGSDGTYSHHASGPMTVVAYTACSGGLGALIGSQLARSERIDLRGMTDRDTWLRLSDLLPAAH